jgi:hypothetical protein
MFGVAESFYSLFSRGTIHSRARIEKEFFIISGTLILLSEVSMILYRLWLESRVCQCERFAEEFIG